MLQLLIRDINIVINVLKAFVYCVDLLGLVGLSVLQSFNIRVNCVYLCLYRGQRLKKFLDVLRFEYFCSFFNKLQHCIYFSFFVVVYSIYIVS